LGHDGAGVVEEIGPQVTGFSPGDSVCFCNGGIGGAFGTYAELATVPEWQLVHVPAGLDPTHAAALPLVAITMSEALLDRAQVLAGEHILIHGGAGGTGHIGIQLAKARGARVATTISSDDKAEFATTLRADLVIRYRETDFVRAARAWTNERGLDVAVDNIGRAVLQRTFAAMAPYGRTVTLIGFPQDDPESSAYNLNLTVHAVMMLTPMWMGLRDRLRQQANHLRGALQLAREGGLKVHVDRTFSLEDVAHAHRYLEQGKVNGKVVLCME
jgi:NADPH2:quinone reductase